MQSHKVSESVLKVAGSLQEPQQQGPPTPGLQDTRPGRTGGDAWDAFPAQDQGPGHQAPAGATNQQSPPLIDFTDTQAQPVAAHGELHMFVPL